MSGRTEFALWTLLYLFIMVPVFFVDYLPDWYRITHGIIIFILAFVGMCLAV